LGNTWTVLQGGGSNAFEIAYTVSTAAGSDTISCSCNPGGCSWTGKMGADLYATLGIGNTASHSVTIATGPQTDSLSITTTTSNSWVCEADIVQGNNNPN